MLSRNFQCAEYTVNTCQVAFATIASSASFTSVFIAQSAISNRQLLMDLMEHPVPPRPCEEVREDRDEPFDRRAGAVFGIVLALGLVGPVDDQRLALHVVARQKPPVAAVL